MASSPTLLLLLLLSSLLFSLTLSDVHPSTPITPTAACNATTDPSFCRSLLPPKGSQNLYSYARFSLSKSLFNAEKFLSLVNRYLARRSSLSPTAIQALEDCQLLAGLNIDFIVSASKTLNTSKSLLDPQTESLQTLLSALLTNQQTCFDGLQATASAWRVKNGLSVPLSNGTKLYSVSLSLFNRAWVPNKKRTRPGKHFARLPRMPRPGRRLTQSSDDSVLVNDVVVVSQDGSGNFTTISDAVDWAPNKTDGSNGYYLIHVSAGVYKEYVLIPKWKRYVMMIGDGINETVVTGDRNNLDGWTTFNSATLAVMGQGFVAINMTFQNTAGPAKHQAVAVRNGADLSTFYSCSFEGYQDTLYTHSMRQFYKDCDIYGTVDFIFGNAAVVFQNCNIYSRLPMQGQSNTITAQGRTDPNQNTGTSIQNCNLLASSDLAADNGSTITYLGRPWKEYSRTVIMESFLDKLITPVGWMPWNGDFALSTLYYAEFNNTGPGSDTSARVNWTGYHDVMNATQASDYTVTSFVVGDIWLPQTGVPYSSGLV